MRELYLRYTLVTVDTVWQAGARINQAKRVEETAGCMRQLWMLPMHSAQIAPGSSCDATQVESRITQKPSLLSVGALKQAHPSRKHMQAGVGRVKMARVFGQVH